MDIDQRYECDSNDRKNLYVSVVKMSKYISVYIKCGIFF